MKTSIYFKDDDSAAIKLTFESKQEKAVIEMAVQGRGYTGIELNETNLTINLFNAKADTKILPQANVARTKE